MPLSRLSPRRVKNTLARQRNTQSRPADNQRHLHLWAAIRTTREELDQWQRQIDQVDALFGKHIVPRERKLTSVVSDVTERLIGHFSARLLDMPDQSLLGLWVTDNLNDLQDHPFGDPDRMRQLSKQWRELLNHDGPIENQLARIARRHSHNANNTTGEEKKLFDDDVIADDMRFSADTHEEKLDVSGKSGAKAENDIQDSNSTEQRHASHNNTTDNESVSDVASTIDSLEQKLSVERLFRQLAKVLHPDREQDDQAKAAKHVLMSECLKARQDKDINALLTLYCEHVGELPDDLNNNSHIELVNALEKQLKELQLELRQKRFGDPLQTQIVERYSASSTADCELRINNHAQSLDAEITSAQLTAQLLSNHEGLLDALDERRAVELDRMAINELTGY